MPPQHSMRSNNAKRNILTFQLLQIAIGSGKICFHLVDDIIIALDSVLLCLDHCQLALKRETWIRS